MVGLRPNTSIDKFLFTWANISISTSILDLDVAQKLVLKANYIINTRHAKNDVIVRPDYPNFPKWPLA